MVLISPETLTYINMVKPTVEPTTKVMTPGFISVVYDVDITLDPDNPGKSAYAISIPGEMNWEDSSGTRKKRLNFVMAMWYIQSVSKGTVLIQTNTMPNTMLKEKDYLIAITDDHQIGRPHIYHPKDTTLSYPYNIGSEIEDDENRNCRASRWDGAKETLRRLFRARWTKTMILLGMLFTVVVLILIGPILKSCLPGIVQGSIHTVKCPDGSTCESFLYLGADCITYSYNCCTGELKEETKPPGGLPDVLPWVIGGIVIVGLLGLGAYLLAKRERK